MMRCWPFRHTYGPWHPYGLSMYWAYCKKPGCNAERFALAGRIERLASYIHIAPLGDTSHEERYRFVRWHP